MINIGLSRATRPALLAIVAAILCTSCGRLMPLPAAPTAAATADVRPATASFEAVSPSPSSEPIVAQERSADRPVPAGKTEPKVTLRVATGDTGDGLIPHQQIISEFQRENPDIFVVIDPAPPGDYYGYLLKQIDAGDPPDIMQIGDDAVPQFVQQSALMDLGPYMRGTYPLNPGIYLPGVFEPGAWKGQQYLLPKDFSPLAVYYNKKIFDQYGVAYPRAGWTWSDFLKTAQSLTRDLNGDGKPDVWGVQMPGAWTTGFEYWVAAAGGQLISDDGRRFMGYINSPSAVAAARFYAALYQKEGVAPEPRDIDAFGGGNTEFADGNAAMMITGHWPQASLRKNPKIDLGVAGMPAYVRRANVLFWSGFGIADSSPNKVAAWRLLRFYTGAQAARIWANWGLPAVKSVAEQLGLANDPIEGVWLGELAHLAPRAYVFTPYWNTTADPAMRQVLRNIILFPGFDVPNALDQAARDAQAALDIRY